MLVVTYDDGDMAIAGKVSVTNKTEVIQNGAGLPLGHFAIYGAEFNENNELILICNNNKRINAGAPATQEPEELNPSPTFTYSGDDISRIDYTNGRYKTFTYDANGTLTQLVYYRVDNTLTRTFNYDANNNLLSITDVET
tara:strand:- start:332 stop:751 length:420 start_codon:yes stop_codon:yes gene_type:complete